MRVQSTVWAFVVLVLFFLTVPWNIRILAGIVCHWHAIPLRDSTVNMLLLPYSPPGFLQIMLYVFQPGYLSHSSTSPENCKDPLNVLFHLQKCSYSIRNLHLHICLTASTTQAWGRFRIRCCTSPAIQKAPTDPSSFAHSQIWCSAFSNWLHHRGTIITQIIKVLSYGSYLKFINESLAKICKICLSSNSCT